MSSSKSASGHQDLAAPEQRLEAVLLLIEIFHVGNPDCGKSEGELKCIKDQLRVFYHQLAEQMGGKLFSGGGGWGFLFPHEGIASCDNACQAALWMLGAIPEANKDNRALADLGAPVGVAIACDLGSVLNDPEFPPHSSDLVYKLVKHGPQVCAENRVTVTERLYAQLTHGIKSSFVKWKHSTELETNLYSTPPAPAHAAAHAPSASTAPQETPPRLAGASPAHAERLSIPGRLRALVGRAGRHWQAGSAFLVALVLGLLLAPGLLRPEQSSPAWNESVRSREWLSWRKLAHEKLSGEQVTESDLLEALKHPPAAIHHSPAGSLRRDQALADVLLSYDGARKLLQKRLGIDKQFLGTGMSKPVGELDYASASIHEYLIPNYPDTNPDVWTWKFQPIGANFRRRVREIIEGDPTGKLERMLPARDPKGSFEQNLKDLIIPRVTEREVHLPPVIRFQKFPAEFYSGKMGRKEAERVFASNLSEVWDLTVQDAAKRSGYSVGAGSADGDMFFIWVFVPTAEHEVVPATWGHVLSRLPKWLNDEKGKTP